MQQSTLPAEDPKSEDAFRQICGAAAMAMDAALAVFLETDDPSGPHKTRVALRRLTTALDAFLPILRRKQSASLRVRAKRIFRLLGELRDSDVHLQVVGEAATAKGLERNRRLREKTRGRLRKDRAVCFPQEVRLAISEKGAIYRRSKAAQDRRSMPITKLAAGVLGLAWEGCRAYGPSVRAIREDRRHDFRKDVKTLRYLAEFFTEQFPALQEDPFRRDFRSIQDDLGLVNDHLISLGLEGKSRPDRYPKPVVDALDRVEGTWARLFAARPPWEDQATRRP